MIRNEQLELCFEIFASRFRTKFFLQNSSTITYNLSRTSATQASMEQSIVKKSPFLLPLDLALKGQQREIVFAHLVMLRIVIKDLIFFGFGRKFAEIEPVLSLLAYSPYTGKHSQRILLIRLKALSVFSVQAKILLAYSEMTRSRRYLRVRLKSLDSITEYD